MSVDLTILAERRTADGRWELAVPWCERPVSFFGVADATAREIHCVGIDFDESHRWKLRALLGHAEPELRDLVPLPRHEGLPRDASEPLQRIRAQTDFGYGWAWALLSEWLEFDWERTTTLNAFDGTCERVTARALAGEGFFTQTLAALRALGPPEAVRVVWYFF